MARKILVLAWAMMRDEVDYDPQRNLEPKPLEPKKEPKQQEKVAI
jgi:hypothetical protein